MHAETNALSSSFVVATVVVSALLVLASVVPAINLVQTASADTFPGTNGKIAFSRQTDFAVLNIFVMNSDGSGLAQLTSGSSIEGHPSWSPDGTKIAFDRYTTTLGNQIYVMNATADGGGQVRLAEGSSPSWSPDGTKIAFTKNDQIYVINADGGSGQTRLAEGSSPSWSPDGTKIAFSALGQIKVMNSDGSNVRAISSRDGDGDFAPCWSPNGTKIAFNRRIETPPNPIPPGYMGSFTSAIYVMNAADGSGQTKLTDYNNTGYLSHPSWSPDGTKIAFESDRSGKAQIYVMNAADGSGQTKLTEAGGFSPDWGVQPHSQTRNSTLAINAISQNDGQVLHIYAKILSADGTVLKRGFTPLNFTGDAGNTYTVSVANYLARDFDHWENNSTGRTRTIDLSAGNAAVTAFYDTGSSKSGYTQLTYNNNAEKPDLTVNATSIGGSGNEFHMWTIIKLQTVGGAGNNNATYTVAASNYGDKVFDHWEDGSMHRMRTLDISEDTTITAYYRTG